MDPTPTTSREERIETLIMGSSVELMMRAGAPLNVSVENLFKIFKSRLEREDPTSNRKDEANGK